MNIVLSKAIRFVLNFIIYCGILIGVAYYTYTNDGPELFALKDLMVPFNGILILAIVLSIILSGINELMTFIIVRRIRRKGT